MAFVCSCLQSLALKTMPTMALRLVAVRLVVGGNSAGEIDTCEHPIKKSDNCVGKSVSCFDRIMSIRTTGASCTDGKMLVLKAQSLNICI